MPNSLLTFRGNGESIYYIDKNHHLLGFLHPKMLNDVNNVEHEDEYYRAKKKYLEAHGVFQNEVEEVEMPLTLFTPHIVEQSIASTEQIVFEVTDRCNLRCKYCGLRDELYEVLKPREMTDMDITDAILLLRQINQIISDNLIYRSSPLVIGFYGGEPLLNFKFIQAVVEYVKAYVNYSVEFNMTTNAMLLHRYMDFIAENNFHLLISLDGDFYHNSYRKTSDNRDSFNKVINNVDELKKRHPEYFDKFVSFNSVLHDRNSIVDIFNYIFKRYGKTPHIGAINPDGIRDIEKFQEMHKSFADDFMRSDDKRLIYEKFFSMSPIFHDLDYFFRVYLSESISDIDELCCNTSKKTLPTGTCLPFNKKIFVSVDKKIHVCEKIDRSFALAELRDEQSFNFDAIADIYNDYFLKIKKVCSKCYRYEFCGKCLFSNRESLKGKAFECPTFLNKAAFKDLMSNMLKFIEKHPDVFQQVLI